MQMIAIAFHAPEILRKSDVVTGSQFHWNKRKGFEMSENSSCLRKEQAYRTLSLQLFFWE